MLVLGGIEVLEDWLQQDSLVPDDLFDLSKVGLKHLLLLWSKGRFTFNGLHVVATSGLIEELGVNELAELVVVEKTWEVGLVFLKETSDVLLKQMNA